MMVENELYLVRQAQPSDVPEIIDVCLAVYPHCLPWARQQLKSHQAIFPEGQLVAVHKESKKVVGFAASLIVSWDDYEWTTPWSAFTQSGMFTNHDPINGKTLYGAEIMVHPSCQGTGAGKLIYKAREQLVRRLGLLRVRAGARLRGYSQHSANMTADEYVLSVVTNKLSDPTLGFQLNRGFHVLKVIPEYLRNDPESLGYAAVIEWINPDVARAEHYAFLKNSKFITHTH